MDNQFTPAPWQVDKLTGEIHIITERGTSAIASLYCDPLDEETIANAHLIAAAPDLLESLQLLQPIIESLINNTPSGEERNNLCDFNIQALTAINKALNQ